MPTYKNNTGGVIQIGGINVPPNSTYETNYYFPDDAGTTYQTITEHLSAAINRGIITKTSDQPTWLLINETLSSATYTDWVYIRGRRNVDLVIKGSFTGTLTLEKKYEEDATDPAEVDTFSSTTSTYFTVPTDAFYRIGFSSYDSGSATVQIG